MLRSTELSNERMALQDEINELPEIRSDQADAETRLGERNEKVKRVTALTETDSRRDSDGRPGDAGRSRPRCRYFRLDARAPGVPRAGPADGHRPLHLRRRRRARDQGRCGGRVQQARSRRVVCGRLPA